jgi:hypothetical protein
MRIVKLLLLEKIRDDPKLQGDSEEVPISEWSGWQFDSRCEIFSLLDKIT